MDAATRRTELALARRSFAALCIVTATLAARAHAQKVWIVDDNLGPGVDYTSILFAANNALNGDLVLVRSGTYANFELDGKGLYIVEDAGADARIFGVQFANTFAIRNLGATQPCWLHGFANSDGALGYVRLEATSCAGALLLTDLGWSLAGVTSQFTAPAFRAQACADVVIDASSFVGSRGWPSCSGGSNCVCVSYAGGVGFTLDASSAAVFASDVRGGTGLDSDPFSSCDHSSSVGGAALVLQGGSRLLWQSIAHGGDGGPGGYSAGPNCVGGANCGGAGAALNDAASELSIADGLVLAGAPGATFAGVCTPPSCGSSSITGPGTVSMLPALPKLALPALAREGATVTATLTVTPSAAPGLAALIVGTGIAALELAGIAGWSLTLGLTAVVPLGAIPPSGSLSRSFVVTELGAGVDFRVLFVQAAQCASGTCSLGALRPIALLDAAF